MTGKKKTTDEQLRNDSPHTGQAASGYDIPQFEHK
jgi:hypothetical protein